MFGLIIPSIFLLSRKPARAHHLILPSFLRALVYFDSVGGMTSGAAFLMVHEQLSFRNRLSKKWIVREMAEAKFQEVKARARAARDDMEPTKVGAMTSYQGNEYFDDIV